MTEAAGCHILAVMGSGETSPTMVTTHRALVARLNLAHPRAILLETPYRFQVNADALSARTQNEYFAKSVGLDVTVLSGLRPPPQPPPPPPAPPPPPPPPAATPPQKPQNPQNPPKRPPPPPHPPRRGRS